MYYFVLKKLIQLRKLFIKINGILLYCTVLIFFLSYPASAVTKINSLNKQTSLAGDWKIKFDDNIEYSFPEYDDLKWDCWELPGSLTPYVFQKDKKTIQGVVWVRKSIFINEKLKGMNIGLILGRIGNADETYFNGYKIGSMGKFPPNDFSMWNHPRHYLISGDLIRYGKENVISVRIYGYVFFEVMGNLAITNYDDWCSDRIIQNFLSISINYIIIFMGVPLFLIMSLILFIRRRDSEYLFYCLQLLSGLFILLELCNFWDIYFNTLTRLKVLLFSWVSVYITHTVFLHRIYELQRKKFEFFLLFSCLPLLLFLANIEGNTSERPIVIVFILLLILLGFYNISCHYSALHKKRPYARLFSLFGIIAILTSMHDGVIYLLKFWPQMIYYMKYTFKIMIFGYGAAALYIGTALVLIHRFINTLDDNDDLISTLETFFLENSVLQEEMNNLRKKYSTLNLSQRFEEKIKQVITYIEENYKSEISREGLAASFDVHPDNLGKLFLKYKKKKLGEYINELRIKDAARQLIETDDNVLDIALSVGFENLRTFNRLFPKYMNLTPYNYRKMKKIKDSSVSDN